MSNEEQAPLNELEIRILTVLARGDLHGYGIAKALDESDGSGPSVLPTNLYRRLHDLADKGLILKRPSTDTGKGTRRQDFALTAAGRERLMDEAERLSALVQEIRSRALNSPPEPAE